MKTVIVYIHPTADARTYVPNARRFVETYMTHPPGETDHELHVAINGGVEIGYLPIWVTRFPSPLTEPEAKWGSLTSPFSIISGQTGLTLDKNLTTLQSATVKADAPSVIQVQTHYFPGWIAKIDGQTTIPAYNNPDGFMELAVPAGEHKIEFKFTSTPIRKFSDYLTLFSSLILILSLFWSKYFGATCAAPKKSPRISKAKP